MQKLYQGFWKSWHLDYLTKQQRRSKWYLAKGCILDGNLVLLKEDNIPPSRWPLGRIIQTHPGRDGLIRVVTVRTKISVFKRPISKICLLPIQDNINQVGDITQQ